MASVIASRRLRRFRNRGCVRRGTLDVGCQRRCRHQIDIRQIAAIDPPFGASDRRHALQSASLFGLVSAASRLVLIVDAQLICRSMPVSGGRTR